MSEANTEELHIESPLSPTTPPTSPKTPLQDDLTEEELSLTEEALNEVLAKTVGLNIVQYFIDKSPYTYNDFLTIRDVCRHVGFELHKPWKLGRQRSLSINNLKFIFGEEAKFIHNITDDDLEYFRQLLLKNYNITFCRCGCTALMMDLDKLLKFRIGWEKFSQDTANKICDEQNLTGAVNRACRRKLKIVQYLRELEQRDEEALDMSRNKVRVNPYDCPDEYANMKAKEDETKVTASDKVNNNSTESMECVADDNATNQFIDSQPIIVD